MKWALIVGGVVAALIAVVIIVGAMLQRDHVAAMTARVGATPDAVWSAISQPAAYPSWRKDVKTVELLAPTPAGPSWREHSAQGAITFVVDAAEPPHRLVTRIADKDLPFGGNWEYLVEPDGPSSSRVTVIERGSVYNPVFRFVSHFIMGHTAAIDAYLRALGKRFGTEPIPTAVTLAGGSHGL
jgi:uncharacterized protein YndB with AHSA1/START domain